MKQYWSDSFSRNEIVVVDQVCRSLVYDRVCRFCLRNRHNWCSEIFQPDEYSVKKPQNNLPKQNFTINCSSTNTDFVVLAGSKYLAEITLCVKMFYPKPTCAPRCSTSVSYFMVPLPTGSGTRSYPALHCRKGLGALLLPLKGILVKLFKWKLLRSSFKYVYLFLWYSLFKNTGLSRWNVKHIYRFEYVSYQTRQIKNSKTERSSWLGSLVWGLKKDGGWNK